MPTPRQIEQRQRRIRRALEAARAALAVTDPANYREDRHYRAVLTTRQRRVRQLERLLQED